MHITRHEDGTITQVGGVVRVTHGQPAPQDPAMQQAIPATTLRTGNSHYEIDQSTGGVRSRNHASHQTSSTPENPQQSIMGSLKSMGGQKTVELEPGNPASRTLLSSAVKDGLVVETAPGVFVDRSLFGGAGNQEGSSGNVEAPEGAPEESPLGVYDEAELDIWNQEVASIPQHSYDKAVAGVTAALAEAAPERLEGVISSLASSTGMEPEQAREFVETGIEWYAETIARDLVKSVGITRAQVEGLWDQFRTQGHPRLAEAIQEVAITGQANVFREVAKEFKVQQALGADMRIFQQQGFETRVDRETGEIMIRRGNQNWCALKDLA
jgi:hypothetical protein